MSNEVASPCIKQCCLNEQRICRSCWRSIDEISQWRNLSNDEKAKVVARCEQRQQQFAPQSR